MNRAGVVRGLGACALMGSVLTGTTAAERAASAGAAGNEPLRLSEPEGAVTFEGRFTDEDSAFSGDDFTLPEACRRVECREITVDVDLPEDVWSSEDGGVQVAVDWFPQMADLNLFVVDESGARIGSATSGSSSGESLRLPDLANGTYRVVVAAEELDGPTDFRGFVEVERAVGVDPVRALLPNLVAAPTTFLTLDPDDDAPVAVEDDATCYPEDTAFEGARRCLNFELFVGNVGEGPFELMPVVAGAAGERRAVQRVYRSDGSHVDETAGTYEPSAAQVNEPVHYPAFADAVLSRRRADGTLETVRSQRFSGHCPFDIRNLRFGAGPDGRPWRGEAPRTYDPCDAGFDVDDSTAETAGVGHVDGISPGWSDFYDKYLEISGVPDGDYLFDVIVNPTGVFAESTRDDNQIRLAIRLTGNHVEILP